MHFKGQEMNSGKKNRSCAVFKGNIIHVSINSALLVGG